MFLTSTFKVYNLGRFEIYDDGEPHTNPLLRYKIKYINKWDEEFWLKRCPNSLELAWFEILVFLDQMALTKEWEDEL